MNVKELESSTFEQIWENAFDAMRLVNAEGVIVEVNKAFCTMVEMSRESLVGRPMAVIYSEPDHDTIQKKLVERFRARKIEISIDRPLMLWNGKKVWFEASNTFVDSENHGTLLLSIFRDITEKKKSEEEAMEYMEELKKLNSEKDKFLSIISHDLRGPFQSLLGMSELLSEEFETMEPDELKEYFASMNRSLRAQYTLLENLLTWSRLQIGQVQMEKEQISLANVIAEVLAVMETTAVQKQITIHAQVPDALRASADVNMLKSVIQNLVSNALKFTPRGGDIYITGESGSSRAAVSIRDTGVGMDEDEIEQLFDITRKKTRKGTDGEKGTGLGLIIIRDMTELMDGTLDIDSRPGEGSTFTIQLPVS
ncbi:PAS domain-containing sensor histidine kinase [Natronogracilivirga saccharolytica]|uniref:histidine kinase n=1 Tax=Natronogracilivirga saccharolytica TaxID=2812953 RepID=A0A8J7USW9_9BACT|nr:PAS domain-containing sensor histidine kinase [Natronogracilivirga saccharolytica]MBP3191991.1 PAS domain S-box protein [Natronogracilivirga saccharolytica]